MADWVKLHTDLLDNPDRESLDNNDLAIWALLLMLARKEAPTTGTLTGWTSGRLSYRLRQDSALIDEALAHLAAVGWLTWDGATLTICHYTDRQYDAPSARPEKVSARVRKHRDGLVTESIVTTCNDLSREVTSGNALEERRIEENRVEEKEKPEPPPPPVAPVDPQFGELVKLLESERIITTYSKTLMDDVGDVWDDHPKLADWKAAILRVKARDPARGNWALLKVIMLDFMRTGSWDKPGGNGHGPPGKRSASRETDYSKIPPSAPVEPYVPMTPEEKAAQVRELQAMGLM